MKIQKIKLLLLAIVLTLYSCKDNVQSKKEQTVFNQKQQNINFDKILKCSDYSYDGNYFITADYGCIYNPKGENVYGNICIYLFPKHNLEINDDEINIENNKINQLDIENYKRDYNIFIYLIPKEFLNYNINGDPIYYQNENYTEELYTFNSSTNKWVLLESLKVDKTSENRFEQNWRDNFIEKQSQKRQENAKITNVSNLIKSLQSKDFSLIKQQTCDLNEDGNQDEILIFGNNKEYKPEDNSTKSAPVIVLINDGENSYTQFQNKNIYPNDFNDLFQNLVIKNSYFTIELSNESPDEYTSNKYVTFKYQKNNKNIVLHKYSEITNWSDGKTNNIIYSDKDFGIVLFNDFSSKNIN